jgi:hypothetical protein
MSGTSVVLRSAALFAPAIVAVITACNASYTLPPATMAPDTGTVTLWALTGTDLSLPSAYSLEPWPPIVVRTDRSSAFDFAFDIQLDSLGDTSAVLLPRAAMGLYADGGLQISQEPFDSIKIAPTGGYQDSLPVPLQVGTVVLAASRSLTCNFGFVYPIYGKFLVTALDLTARSVTFSVLVDSNCGYRGLQNDSVPPTR